MKTASTASVTALLVALAAAPPAQTPPDPFKVMITEVSWAEPDGVELTNHGPVAADLGQHRVVWKDLAGTASSAPLGVVLAPGASIVVVEANAAPTPETPPGVLILPLLPSLATSLESFAVALQDAQGGIVDDVLVTDTAGVATAPLGAGFRGSARRGTLGGSVSLERIWGLDSDGGRDWTEELVRGFGLESRSAGARNGTDPIAVPAVWIHEVDTAPGLVELLNRTATSLELQDWYLLVSEAQGAPVRRVNPWPSAMTLAIGQHVVLGEGVTPPPELPGTIAYVPLPTGALALGPAECSLGLYDRLGRLVDLVRATAEGGEVVHNHPRLPSWPADFHGAAPRLLAGDRTFGRASPLLDSNTGGDWRAIAQRTMGAPNTGFVGPNGHSDRYDVRVHEGSGNGLTVIHNAGTSSAGHAYSYFFSFGHLDGTGPVFGLGPDALLNWLAILALPPFSGILDGRGSARFDFPPGSVPPGVDCDCVFILQAPGGGFSKRTLILEYDS